MPPGASGGVADAPGVDEVPAADEPSDAGPDPVDAATEPVAMPATTGISSRLGGVLLPLLFLGGLLGSLAVAGTRFFVRPPRQG